MAKPEWGKKRICPSCGLKYYDFNNSPIKCPSCQTEFDPDLYLRSRKGKALSSKLSSENNSEMSEDISDIDDIDAEDDVVSDDDALIEISKDNQDDDSEDIDIDDNVSFIDDDDLNDDDDNLDIDDTKNN
ncbi:MAG: TIGR02300 family protein [Candidatus Puniceispirillales bacterium]